MNPQPVTSRHRHRSPPRRGIAMALVLISVALATILAVSFLSSRDNSGEIGRNVSNSTRARSAAVGGLNRAIAVMETPTAWRATAQTNLGKLLDEAAPGGGHVTVTLEDLVTGAPPTAESTYFAIDVRGESGGVAQHVTATAYVPLHLPLQEAAAVDLAEFAIAAGQEIMIEGNARIDRWAASPLARLRRRVNLAIGALTAGSVLVGGSVLVVDGTLYHDDSAQQPVVSYPSPANPLPLRTKAVSSLPMPGPPPPSHVSLGLGTDLEVTSSMTISSNGEYHLVTVGAETTLTLQGPLWLVADSLILEPGARIVIEGGVELIATGDLTLAPGASIVTRNGSLRLHVGDDLSCDGAFIGDEASADTSADAGEHPYTDPMLIQIFELAGLELGPRTWTIGGNSIVKASFYGPSAVATFGGAAVLYGRVAAGKVGFFDDAALFYDHALDARCGYATEGSGVFQSGTAVRTEMVLVPTLEDKVLDNLAAELGFIILAGGEVNDDHHLAPIPTATPTPRIAPVECTIESVGAPAVAGAHPLEGS